MAKAFDYQMILDTYRRLQEEANAANEARYQDILGTIDTTTERVGQTYDQIEGLLSTLGDTERERIDMGRVRSQANSEQDLISRGLGNTTIRSSVQRGIEDDANRSQRELTEQVSRQKAGVLQPRAGAEERLGNFLAQTMEARTDQGPDLGYFTQLLNQAGAGDAGNEQRTTFGGLSANARAGRNAFGGEGPAAFRRSGGGGSPGGAGGFSAAAGGGSGGGSGGQSGVKTVRGGSRRQSGPAGGRTVYGGGGRRPSGGNVYRAAADNAAGRYGGANPADAGVAGSAFDDLFSGQRVISGGDFIGDYAGGGQVNLDDNLNLVDQRGELDPNRFPGSLGGAASTPEEPRDAQQQEGGSYTFKPNSKYRGANRGPRTVTANSAAEAYRKVGFGWSLVSDPGD